MDARLLSTTLDAIYEAGSAPERWPEALANIGRMFGCSCVSLVNKDRDTNAGSAAAWGIDAAGHKEYLDVWLERNVLHHRTKIWREGQVETDQDILPKKDFVRSDYYNGFLKRRDMHAMLRVATFVVQKTIQTLALARPKLAGEYERSDAKTLQPLVRHIQRATAISRQLQESQLSLRSTFSVLDLSLNGIFLLDRKGRVIFVNKVALTVVRSADSIAICNDRLQIDRRAIDEAFQKLVNGALARASTIEAARGGAIRIERKSGKQPYLVVVGPLAENGGTGESTAVAFVTIADPEANSNRPTWLLRDLFGFSITETLVAERLMAGDSPEKAAAALNMKISTARWHINAILQKTETHRQPDLIRLLLMLPRL
jgi:DNA-binding CsgD family transcriptional regulator